MKKILLLEQNLSSREALEECLNPKYEIVRVESVKDGEEILEKRNDIDLIVSSLHIDGAASVFDLLRIAKKRSVPFVFCCVRASQLTQTLRDSLVTTSKLLGAHAILIQEDFNSDELLSAIEVVFGQA